MFKEINTERLLIRKFKESDLLTFYHYRADKEVERYQSWQNYSFLEAMQFIDQILKSDFDGYHGTTQVAIEEKATNKHIGDVYISIDDMNPHRCFIGYTLARDSWGKGYAYEAVKAVIDTLFYDYQISEVHALVLKENERSLKLIYKLGFTFVEGYEYCLYKSINFVRNKNMVNYSYTSE